MSPSRTERVERVVVAAQAAAEPLGSTRIDAGQLLLAFLTEGNNVVAQALREMGLSDRKARETMTILAEEDRDSPETSQFTSSAIAALSHASDEAERRGSRRVTTAHLLLGIVAYEDNRATKILHVHNIEPDDLIEYVATLIPDELDKSATPTAGGSSVAAKTEDSALSYLRPRSAKGDRSTTDALTSACAGWEYAVYSARDARGLDPDTLATYAQSIVSTLNSLHAVTQLLSTINGGGDNSLTGGTATESTELLHQLGKSLRLCHSSADRYWSLFNDAETPFDSDD